MSPQIEEIFIGLMSGTSIDAIDAAAVVIDKDNDKHVNVIATHTHTIPSNIKHAITSLCQPGDNEIMRMGELDHQLGELFASATLELLRSNGLKSSQISAIGSHGQTIRHMPNGKYPFTLQIGNPALISELTNITTIADFRRADLAAGGQGAPLVPAFHQAIFNHDQIKRVILNIGGMANISIVENGKVSGFDTGPGNILLNEWILKNKNLAYDKDGAWAKEGTINLELLDKMLGDNYFTQPPPKSTGREHFNLDWINTQTTELNTSSENIQCTLSELTAKTIADAIKIYASNCEEVLVCGGGVHNEDLIARLQKHCIARVFSTEKVGVNPDYVEAAAFAWFARQTLHNIPSNIPAVTGAKRLAILGATYHASR